MPQKISEIMTEDPVKVQRSDTVGEVARAMKQADIGDVLVCEGETLVGILTDRDIVIRGLAEGKDPTTTPVGDLCSDDLHVLRADDPIDEAVRIEAQHAVRRIPVVGDGMRPVGVVSLGDLAVDRDPDSALAAISAAPPNE